MRGLAVFGAVLALCGCAAKKAPEEALQTVRVGTVQEIHPDMPERYSATIVAGSTVDLAFKSGGLIASVLQVRGADGRVRDVGAGDRVAEGTDLAVVRRVDYEQKVQQSKDQVAQAIAQLQQAEAGLQQAQADFTRADNLYKQASLTRPDYDQAKARYDSQVAQVAAAQAAIGNARTVVSEADLSLSDATLKAPFTGWITARNVEKGSLVGNATIGFSMVDTSVVKAVFAVPDTSLGSVRLGQRLSVAIDALPDPIAGVITAISPEADAKTHVFSVEVTVANGRNRVRPGMIGSITVGPARVAGERLVVPLSAVVRAPGRAQQFAVYRLQDRGGKTYVAAQPITAGNTYGNAIEVTGGVTAGERIVILGGELVRDGQEVRVLQ